MTVNRDDLENKLREVESAVDEVGDRVAGRSKWVLIGLGVAVVAVVGLSLWRRSKQPRITVEVYRQ
jgi:flagellar biosynthesis/type III secretory pathway M-ring protein FliF/YscJ